MNDSKENVFDGCFLIGGFTQTFVFSVVPEATANAERTARIAMMIANASQPWGPCSCFPVARKVKKVVTGTTMIVRPFQPIEPVNEPNDVRTPRSLLSSLMAGTMPQ